MNTLSTAKEFDRNGKINEWVQIFLRGGENSNMVLADELQNGKNHSNVGHFGKPDVIRQ